MLEIEKNLHNKGYRFVAGVDEAGRGPLAGPVCAAAVILPDDVVIDGINDSKKLTEKKREQLFDVICEKAIAYSVEFASPDVIDEINIRQATSLAMHNAVKNLDVCEYKKIQSIAKNVLDEIRNFIKPENTEKEFKSQIAPPINELQFIK